MPVNERKFKELERETKRHTLLSRINRDNPYSLHDVNLFPLLPIVKQQIIKGVRNGVLISTLENSPFYETMVFPVDLGKKEVVPEVLFVDYADTKEEAYRNHTEAFRMVSSVIRTTMDDYLQKAKEIDAHIISKLREKN
jgi:hypothetical protein